jgi:hypothetical protein
MHTSTNSSDHARTLSISHACTNAVLLARTHAVLDAQRNWTHGRWKALRNVRFHASVQTESTNGCKHECFRASSLTTTTLLCTHAWNAFLSTQCFWKYSCLQARTLALTLACTQGSFTHERLHDRTLARMLHFKHAYLYAIHLNARKLARLLFHTRLLASKIGTQAWSVEGTNTCSHAHTLSHTDAWMQKLRIACTAAIVTDACLHTRSLDLKLVKNGTLHARNISRMHSCTQVCTDARLTRARFNARTHACLKAHLRERKYVLTYSCTL